MYLIICAGSSITCKHVIHTWLWTWKRGSNFFLLLHIKHAYTLFSLRFSVCVTFSLMHSFFQNEHGERDSWDGKISYFLLFRWRFSDEGDLRILVWTKFIIFFFFYDKKSIIRIWNSWVSYFEVLLFSLLSFSASFTFNIWSRIVNLPHQDHGLPCWVKKSMQRANVVSR